MKCNFFFAGPLLTVTVFPFICAFSTLILTYFQLAIIIPFDQQLNYDWQFLGNCELLRMGYSAQYPGRSH